MSAVTFYFDPACPFAWATYRCLANTARRRDIEIDWRQIGLAVFNKGADVSEQQRHHMEVSEQLGRVLAAAHGRAGDSALGPLCTAWASVCTPRAPTCPQQWWPMHSPRAVSIPS
ncbi:MULTISPECIES: hypothetical protein [Williamsia]|uniref:mycothiol-dependent nitroreductase Rv2466c family protein n=1 Tax=Williamsia sp. D3 TaxID=1313067 RepID=UPI00041B8965|nr:MULTISPECIES: hypothetical protein [Williamsia]PVY24967.1 hypothetical protein C7458_11935 [Williamsia marianensis]